MKNATSFGTEAQAYAADRPSYPAALFDWIAGQTPGSDLVWDVGTGSGQAARALVERFNNVHATDIDPAQLAQAVQHPNISYVANPAHQSGLPDNSVDAITVATALHWFDFEMFWPEVKRVAKPGAVFCAWTYHRVETDIQTNEQLIQPVLDIVDPYWSDGNRLSWAGYNKETVSIPFEIIDTPEFACELNWNPARISAYMRTWSAHNRARQDGQAFQLNKIEEAALKTLGDAPRKFRLPLHVLTACIS